MCPPTQAHAIMVRLGSELERSRELESGRELAGLHKDTKPIIRKQRQVYYRARCGGQSPHRPLRFKVGHALSLSTFAFITCFVTYMTTTPQPSTTTCRMCGPWHRVRLRTCKVALQEIQPAFHSRLDGGQCGIVHCTDHHTQHSHKFARRARDDISFIRACRGGELRLEADSMVEICKAHRCALNTDWVFFAADYTKRRQGSWLRVWIVRA